MRCHGDRQDDARGASSPNALDASLRGVAGGDAIVCKEHGAIRHRWNGTAADAVEPLPKFLALMLGDLAEFLVGDADVVTELSVDDQYRCVIDRPDGELGVAGCAKLSHRANAQREMQLDGNRLRNHDPSAWNAEHDGLVGVSMALERNSKSPACLDAVAENHATTIWR